MEDIEEENSLLKDKIKMLEELAVSANGPCSLVCFNCNLIDCVVLFFRSLRKMLRK